jgi:hypothetical protein
MAQVEAGITSGEHSYGAPGSGGRNRAARLRRRFERSFQRRSQLRPCQPQPENDPGHEKETPPRGEGGARVQDALARGLRDHAGVQGSGGVRTAREEPQVDLGVADSDQGQLSGHREHGQPHVSRLICCRVQHLKRARHCPPPAHSRARARPVARGRRWRTGRRRMYHHGRSRRRRRAAMVLLDAISQEKPPVSE